MERPEAIVVADASVITKWFVEEEYSKAFRKSQGPNKNSTYQRIPTKETLMEPDGDPVPLGSLQNPF
ncbi:MAG: hypothetical protein ACE5Z5_06560 [Candidatus Bathyarchaeia archaeon]